jgi:hypothetical protein
MASVRPGPSTRPAADPFGPFATYCAARPGERDRTTDLPFTRSTTPRTMCTSCTDDADHRIDGSRCAGIIRAPFQLVREGEDLRNRLVHAARGNVPGRAGPGAPGQRAAPAGHAGADPRTRRAHGARPGAAGRRPYSGGHRRRPHPETRLRAERVIIATGSQPRPVGMPFCDRASLIPRPSSASPAGLPVGHGRRAVSVPAFPGLRTSR